MTATESRKHIDGGTYRVLRLAETANRWAIALTEWTTYRGNIRYQVLRVNPDNLMLALGTFRSEAAARAAANRAWSKERAALVGA